MKYNAKEGIFDIGALAECLATNKSNQKAKNLSDAAFPNKPTLRSTLPSQASIAIRGQQGESFAFGGHKAIDKLSSDMGWIAKLPASAWASQCDPPESLAAVSLRNIAVRLGGLNLNDGQHDLEEVRVRKVRRYSLCADSSCTVLRLLTGGKRIPVSRRGLHISPGLGCFNTKSARSKGPSAHKRPETKLI